MPSLIFLPFSFQKDDLCLLHSPGRACTNPKAFLTLLIGHGPYPALCSFNSHGSNFLRLFWEWAPPRVSILRGPILSKIAHPHFSNEARIFSLRRQASYWSLCWALWEINEQTINTLWSFSRFSDLGGQEAEGWRIESVSSRELSSSQRPRVFLFPD